MLEIFAKEGAISTPELQRRLNLSGRTLLRARQELEKEFDMRFGWIQKAEVGNVGDWVVDDWGWFSPREIRKRSNAKGESDRQACDC